MSKGKRLDKTVSKEKDETGEQYPRLFLKDIQRFDDFFKNFTQFNNPFE